MPSATTQISSAGSIPKQSSLVGRVRPLSVTPDARSMRVADRLCPVPLSDRRLQTCGAGVQVPHRFVSIGLLGPLVLTIPLDAREAQGEPTRVLRALLEVVEGDLHY